MWITGQSLLDKTEEVFVIFYNVDKSKDLIEQQKNIKYVKNESRRIFVEVEWPPQQLL